MCKMFLFRIMLHRTLKQFYNPFIWSQTLFLYPFIRGENWDSELISMFIGLAKEQEITFT